MLESIRWCIIFCTFFRTFTNEKTRRRIEWNSSVLIVRVGKINKHSALDRPTKSQRGYSQSSNMKMSKLVAVSTIKFLKNTYVWNDVAASTSHHALTALLQLSFVASVPLNSLSRSYCKMWVCHLAIFALKLTAFESNEPCWRKLSEPGDDRRLTYMRTKQVLANSGRRAAASEISHKKRREKFKLLFFFSWTACLPFSWLLLLWFSMPDRNGKTGKEIQL